VNTGSARAIVVDVDDVVLVIGTCHIRLRPREGWASGGVPATMITSLSTARMITQGHYGVRVRRPHSTEYLWFFALCCQLCVEHR
jgi:hypothetical protein